jgi:2-keto-4-pentenoate hydratase
VQKRFNHDAPLRGTLFKSMLVADGAELPVSFGTRPVFEADMIVEVADPAALAKADTPWRPSRRSSFSPSSSCPT